MLLLSWISAVFVSLTGLYVLFHGDWRHLRLKYAAVSLSTVASFWVITAMAMDHSTTRCLHSDMMCFSLALYHVVRNLAFILFHLAVGRDAISIKKNSGERRQWTRNTLPS